MWRLILLTIFCMPSPAFAWSGKEHVQLTRMAVEQLLADEQTPPDMKAWLENILPNRLDMAGERDYLLNARIEMDLERSGGGVLYWAMVPDTAAQRDPRDKKVDPFGVHERLMHYIDLELFVAGNKQRKFRDDLTAKPAMADVRRDWRDERYIQAGYLPFAIEHSYQQLVKAIREDRLKPVEGDGSLDDQSAMRWAGYLAHYLQDNTQPHHSTVDFKSRSYFNDRRDAPDIHKEMEYRMVDDTDESFPELRAAYWQVFETALKEFRDPIATNDAWQASLDVSFVSYDALPLIGAAAVAAAQRRPGGGWSFDTEKFFMHEGVAWGQPMTVMQMKARQQAWAISRTRAMLLAAWREAQQELPVGPETTAPAGS